LGCLGINDFFSKSAFIASSVSSFKSLGLGRIGVLAFFFSFLGYLRSGWKIAYSFAAEFYAVKN